MAVMIFRRGRSAARHAGRVPVEWTVVGLEANHLATRFPASSLQMAELIGAALMYGYAAFSKYQLGSARCGIGGIDTV